MELVQFASTRVNSVFAFAFAHTHKAITKHDWTTHIIIQLLYGSKLKGLRLWCHGCWHWACTLYRVVDYLEWNVVHRQKFHWVCAFIRLRAFTQFVFIVTHLRHDRNNGKWRRKKKQTPTFPANNEKLGVQKICVVYFFFCFQSLSEDYINHFCFCYCYLFGCYILDTCQCMGDLSSQYIGLPKAWTCFTRSNIRNMQKVLSKNCDPHCSPTSSTSSVLLICQQTHQLTAVTDWFEH